MWSGSIGTRRIKDGSYRKRKSNGRADQAGLSRWEVGRWADVQ